MVSVLSEANLDSQLIIYIAITFYPVVETQLDVSIFFTHKIGATHLNMSVQHVTIQMRCFS
jgi:hypothetical protein